MKKFLIIAAYVSLFMLAVLNCEQAGKKDAEQPKQDAVTEQPAPVAEQPQAQVAETTPAENAEAPKTQDIADASKTAKDADANAKAEPQKSGSPMKGKAVSLNSIVTGGDGTISRADAIAQAGKGQPIVFLSGGKVYFVYNADGTFAGGQLAKFASNESIGIVGKTKVVKGVNIIIADMIEAM